LIVNGTQDSGVKLLCLDEDIVDYIEEPLITEILKKRIELQVITVRQRNQLMMQTNILESQRDELRKYNLSLKTVIESKSKEVQELQMAILATIAILVESRDDVTGGHLERTKKGLEILLTAAYDDKILGPQIKDWDFRLCLQSSQMHDVGKISIDDSILKKPGSLDKDVFTSMQHNTVYGAKLIDKIKMNAIDNTFLEYAKIFAESHHEKWNGTGYPYGLYGEAIPLKGRLLAVVDVYDALVSARPYKEPFSHEEAVRMIESGSGTHFDPDVNRVFMAVQDKYKAIEFTKEEILTRKDTLR
jgi:putative two-component system response regulator